MRKRFAAGLFGLCLAVCTSPFLAAQDSIGEPMNGPRPAPQIDSRSQHLIHERAAIKAQNRMSRIESRRWTGQSTLRPIMGPGANRGDLFQNIDRGGVTRFGYWGYYGPINAPYIAP